MKARILILLFILIFNKKVSAQSSQIQMLDQEMYIYEFAIKKIGRANIGFLIIENNLCWDISFDVHFSKDKIKKVDKFVRIYYYDNNIAKKIGGFYHSNNDFVKKRRLIPDNIYKIISPFFLEITNKERLEILDGFSKYKCDFNHSNIKFNAYP